MIPARLECRADLFEQLAALDDAGLAAAAAFEAVAADAPADLAAAARRVARAAGAGMTVATAGQRAGLFTALETRLVEVYAQAGAPGDLYRALAKRYRGAAVRARQLRNRLILPAAVAVLAVVIGPLPRVVGGTLAAGAYLLQTAAMLFIGAAVAMALLRLPGWLQDRSAGGTLAAGIDALLLKLPLAGPLTYRRQRLRFLDALGLLLAGGLPAAEALRGAATAVPNQRARSEFAACAAPVAGGAAVVASLSAAGCLDRDQEALLATGEAAGRLAESIARVVDSGRQQLDMLDRQLLNWLPRLVYLLVFAAVVKQFFGAATPLLN